MPDKYLLSMQPGGSPLRPLAWKVKRGLTRADCSLKGERYKKETVDVQAERSLYLEYLARCGNGLPSRLAGLCGGAGTRQPEVLGEDP